MHQEQWFESNNKFWLGVDIHCCCITASHGDYLLSSACIDIFDHVDWESSTIILARHDLKSILILISPLAPSSETLSTFHTLNSTDILGSVERPWFGVTIRLYSVFHHYLGLSFLHLEFSLSLTKELSTTPCTNLSPVLHRN